jgi:DNA segregation ATPase FtsK/SpoIIIE, S-DNA-T family
MIKRRLSPIVVKNLAGDRDLTVGYCGTHTVDDLAVALGVRTLGARTEPLVLEPGQVFDGDRGQFVESEQCVLGEPVDASAGREVDGERTDFELVVVGGSCCGQRWPLGSLSALSSQPTSRPVVIGRTNADVSVSDPTVSVIHAILERDSNHRFVLTDRGSRNGTFVNEHRIDQSVIECGDVLRFGSIEMELRPVNLGDRPVGLASFGATRFNRPPRHLRRNSQAPIEVPVPPPPMIGRAPFRVSAVAVPLLFAVGMVMITKQILFVAFAVMSPVMMVANAISDRRSNRDRARRDLAFFHSQLLAFSSQLELASGTVRSAREEMFPDLAEVLRRTALPSRRLWERRPEHHDFLRIRLGRGDFRWTPAFASEVPLGNFEIDEILNQYAYIPNVAIDVNLEKGAILGVSGPRPVGLAMLRSLLVQVACHHGPADVRIVIAAGPDRIVDWDWLKWLPHLDPHADVAIGSDEITVLAKSLMARTASDRSVARSQSSSPSPVTLVVLDVDSSTLTELPALRSWFEHSDRPCSMAVLTDAVDTLPSSCTSVLSISEAAAPLAQLTDPGTGASVPGILLNCLVQTEAVEAARNLCRYTDPESTVAGAMLPTAVSLAELLGFSSLADPDELSGELVRRWSGRSGRLERSHGAPIGVSEHGPLTIDRDTDGPHGLIGGTTGAGKSELLRSIVVSLALQSPPTDLTFVLIDYKGGSAFDECAKLPHVVGMVTDLDEALSARAVVCLEAELRYREQFLRSVGASDRDSYVRMQNPRGPFPRLAIVVDEFAALKTELPEFIDALVDVAQRGRSLGVHLLLATQRPAGVVSDLIRANTELKIALRMQETSDSVDVIGAPDAASLPRHRRGMALARFGSEQSVSFQAAYTGGVASVGEEPISLHPFALGVPPSEVKGPTERNSTTELQVLVQAARDAHQLIGGVAPRRPWPDPLPETLKLQSVPQSREREQILCGQSVLVPNVGITDDPANQSQGTLRWDLDRGNLLLIGARRADTTAALHTLGVSFAAGNSPSDLHVYGVVSQGSALSDLASLPHVGDVVAISDRVKLLRLIRQLSAELAERSTNSQRAGIRPVFMLLIDGLASLKLELDDPTQPLSAWDQLMRILVEGPRVGIVSALTIDRPSLVSGPLAAVAEQRWLFRLNDRLDYSLFGVRGTDVPALGPMRCIDAQSELIAQIGSADDFGDTAARAWDRPEAGAQPVPVRLLPNQVLASNLPLANLEQRPWILPIGISDVTLEEASAYAHPGEHLLVTGPSRSGRTSVLASLAASAADDAVVIVVAPSRSPLPSLVPSATALRADQIATLGLLLEGESTSGRPVLVLIDDAELIEDQGGLLTRLVGDEDPNLFVGVAVRPELLRANYTHWSRHIRRSRLAVLLRPSDLDAEFAGISIPRRGIPSEVGRGFLSQNGSLELVQFAFPDPILDHLNAFGRAA